MECKYNDCAFEEIQSSYWNMRAAMITIDAIIDKIIKDETIAAEYKLRQLKHIKNITQEELDNGIL